VKGCVGKEGEQAHLRRRMEGWREGERGGRMAGGMERWMNGAVGGGLGGCMDRGKEGKVNGGMGR